MTWDAHKGHSKWSRYSKVKRLGYHRVRTTAWARPYAEPIETIDTGRGDTLLNLPHVRQMFYRTYR